MTSGAKGSAAIGRHDRHPRGLEVLRYPDHASPSCWGLERMMADGRSDAAHSGLHKDNTGLDLRQLLIRLRGNAREIVTAGRAEASRRSRAPLPRHGRRGVAARRARLLLNRLKDASGGAVEAFDNNPEIVSSPGRCPYQGARKP